MVELTNNAVWLMAAAGLLILVLAVSIYIHNKRSLTKFLNEHEGPVGSNAEPPKLTAKQKKDIENKVIKNYEGEVLASTKEHEKVISYSKPYHPFKRISKLKFRYWKDWFIDRYMTAKVMLVYMELNNGFHKQFVVREKENSFMFMGGQYVIDDSSKFYVLDAKMYASFYHQGCSIPIKIEVPLKDIKETLEKTQITEIEYALNPKTLERFQTAKIAEGIMQGQGTAEILKQQRLLILIGVIVSTMTLGYLLYSTGAFQGVGL